MALILASTFFLASSDAIAKHLAAVLPAVEIAWLRYLGFCCIMVPVVLARGPARPLRSNRPGWQVLRAIGLLGSALLFISCLRFLPIADATAITFVSPIFVMALSIPLLGEHVGWRRWAAAVVGLAGVVVIVRPGASAFHPAALLPILSALCWAGTLIVTRKLSGVDHPVTTMAFSAAVGLLAVSTLVPFVWIRPGWPELMLGAFVGLASTTGHWLVVLAYRHGAASVLAPFQYSQLIWASLFGFLLFGMPPDRATFIGAGLIIASGLYIAHRERVRRKKAGPA